jgi:hypothetical protein
MVNQAFLEWLEEEKDPTLKISRGVERWLRKGKSQAWIRDRRDGMTTRRELTDSLQAAGCKYGYINATQAVARAVTGKTKADRDAMNERELRRVQFLEGEIAAEIQARGVQGDKACYQVVREVLAMYSPKSIAG